MKLTRKQHITRALLLGRVYDLRDGTYSFLFEGETYRTPMSGKMIDCETLEPVSVDDADKRSKHYNNNIYDWDQYDYPGTMPWEAEPDEET